MIDCYLPDQDTDTLCGDAARHMVDIGTGTRSRYDNLLMKMVNGSVTLIDMVNDGGAMVLSGDVDLGLRCSGPGVGLGAARRRLDEATPELELESLFLIDRTTENQSRRVSIEAQQTQ